MISNTQVGSRTELVNDEADFAALEQCPPAVRWFLQQSNVVFSAEDALLLSRILGPAGAVRALQHEEAQELREFNRRYQARHGRHLATLAAGVPTLRSLYAT